MKPSELYQRKPVYITRCLGHLKGFYYDHLEELSENYYVDSYFGLEDKNDKITIRFYVDHSFDGRRVWQLASVWYEEQPVMILQNAGREGDDHSRRFITNESAYKSMTEYILSLLDKSMDFSKDVVEEDDDLEGLDNFYNHHMDRFSSVQR